MSNTAPITSEHLASTGNAPDSNSSNKQGDVALAVALSHVDTLFSQIHPEETNAPLDHSTSSSGLGNSEDGDSTIADAEAKLILRMMKDGGGESILQIIESLEQSLETERSDKKIVDKGHAKLKVKEMKAQGERRFNLAPRHKHELDPIVSPTKQAGPSVSLAWSTSSTGPQTKS